MAYCIYLRKSRADAEAEARGEGETLARHKKALLELAKKQNLTIIKIFEEVVSGETIAARPQMQILLSEVEKSLYDGVLVMEVERLARGNTIDQGIIAEAFKYSNTKIITPAKIFDPNNEFDEEYFEFGLFMSRREYKTINRRLQRGKLASVNEGKYVGNIPPYGYNRIKLQDQKGFTLEPNKTEADIVKLIFQLYTKGNSQTLDRIGVSKICNYLNNLGIKPRKTAYWVPATIQTIIRNPVYIGKIKWNSRKIIKIVENGEIKNTRPRAEHYTLVDGLHLALIDEKTFNLAQKYINSNRANPVNLDKAVKNPLAGILKCSICGRNMVRRPYANKKQKDTIMCPYVACGNISSTLEEVENTLYDMLKDWFDNYKIEWEQKKNNIIDITSVAIENTLTNLKKEKETIKKQLNSLHNLLEQGIYDIPTFLERSKILNTKLEELEQAIKSNEADLLTKEKIKINETDLMPKWKKLLETYYKCNSEERNKLLKEVLEKVVYLKKEKNKKNERDKKFELILYPKMPKN